MNHTKRESALELNSNISTVLPAVELFSNPSNLDSSWPKSIAKNPEFIRQIRDRRELNKRLELVFSKLPRPDVSFPQAIEEKYLTEGQVIDLYVSICKLLEENTDYQRIILYLPFEMLPRHDWQTTSPELEYTLGRFEQAYMNAWNNLLSVQDVRANFVNGDVLESVTRSEDHPRVVKAVHLIPKLVEAGMLSVDNVFELIEINNDKTLINSIADTLPVLFDLGLLTDKHIKQIKSSLHVEVRSKVDLLVKNEEVIKNDAPDVELLSIQEKISTEFEVIDQEKYSGITKKRELWLRQQKELKVIQKVSDDIQFAVINDSVDFEKFLNNDVQPEAQQALINGIRQAIEVVGNKDLQKARELYKKYHTVFETLWAGRSGENDDDLRKAFYRLHHLGILPASQLKSLGILIPKLAGPFSENLAGMESDMSGIKNIIKAIEQDQAIQKFIYPVALVYGSRLKGYGSPLSDIDIAIIVKPGVDYADQAKMRGKLRQLFDHDNIQGEVLEFWLENTSEGLNVRELPQDDHSIGDKHFTYILFGAIWEGNKDTINDLREQLLVPYLTEQDKTNRKINLEELERDSLQYRLMHKGYERYYPRFGGLNTSHADQVDGKSMFWDSGYRWTATKLFASRVFLPKI